MTLATKPIFVALLANMLLTAPVPAATRTAASCNASDVQAAVNAAASGDTVIIPAGSCRWTTGVTVPNNIGISIIGAGQGSTTLTDAITGGAAMFSMSPAYGTSLSQISSMTLLPTVPNTGFSSPVQVVGTCTSSGCPNLRIDHITAPSSWAANGLSDDTFAIVVNVFGVADHNTIGDVQPASNGVDFINVAYASWQGIGSYGDNSWASADTLGTAQTFYLENNIFNYAIGTDTDTNAGGGGGGRFACRFNIFNSVSSGGACTGHGTDTNGRVRGGRQWEAYYNTGTCTSATTGCGSAWPGRSGVGVSFANSFANSGGGFMTRLVGLDAQRTWRADTPWGGCGGTSVWDTNDGTTYYSGTVGTFTGLGSGTWTITDSGSPGWTTNQWAPNGAPYTFYDVTQSYGIFVIASAPNSLTLEYLCEGCISFRPAPGDSYHILRSTVCMDQPARSGGLLVGGTYSSPALVSTGNLGAVSETLDPIYQAGDTLPSTGEVNISSNELSVIANRDYYSESVNQAAQTSATSPFNGTSGTGHGTLANRPSTCTPRVGYWATDQGSWNTSSSGGQGELFVCTVTNTWTLYYTPYTYPHPLTQGTGTTAPPANLVVTPR